MKEFYSASFVLFSLFFSRQNIFLSFIQMNRKIKTRKSSRMKKLFTQAVSHYASQKSTFDLLWFSMCNWIINISYVITFAKTVRMRLRVIQKNFMPLKAMVSHESSSLNLLTWKTPRENKFETRQRCYSNNDVGLQNVQAYK